MFTLLFAPSAKRIIPYPPVSIFMLASSLAGTGIAVNPVDLEIELNHLHRENDDILIYKRRLQVGEVLAPNLNEEVRDFAAKITALLNLDNTTHIGISVMGYEQLATALLIARISLLRKLKVIMGGQFWVEKNAAETLSILSQFGDGAVITVGDGNQAIRDFVLSPEEVPTNSYMPNRVAGSRIKVKSKTNVEPGYARVNWGLYNNLAKDTYRRKDSLRRAHLFVWGKKCNFRCAFCRVASGSDIKLTPSIDSVRALKALYDQGVTQLNIMTNELNPSKQYLLQFLTEMESHIGNNNMSWFTYLRADEIPEEALLRLRRVGGKLMRYGIESGSQKLLDFMRKDYNVKTMSETLKYAAAANIWNHVNLLVGFPHEDDEDIELTCQFLENNRNYIHSVRVNPFYLPPDTPIARKPEEFDIKLTGFSKGWWDFNYLDNRDVSQQEVIKKRIERLTHKCEELNIGFAGTDPFFLLDCLDRFDTVMDTLTYLREYYSFFWIPAPTDYYKAMIGNYQNNDGWEKSINKRGINYSLSICND